MSLRHSYICIRWTLHQLVAIIKFGEIASRSRALAIQLNWFVDVRKLTVHHSTHGAFQFENGRSVIVCKWQSIASTETENSVEKRVKSLEKLYESVAAEENISIDLSESEQPQWVQSNGAFNLIYITNSSMAIAIGFVCLIKFIRRKPHNPNVGFACRAYCNHDLYSVNTKRPLLSLKA